VQVYVNLAGLCPEKLKRLPRGGDIPPLAVTADITGELAADWNGVRRLVFAHIGRPAIAALDAGHVPPSWRIHAPSEELAT
jgi:hypothetical protein